MFFGKSKEEKAPTATGEQAQQEEPKEQKQQSSETLSLPQVSAELDKLKAQFSSYYELQKASNERFARMNEQIGELRALLADRDRTAQQLEAKAARAVDIVSTVQPEKLSIEMQKTDAKVEALKATIESNEMIMHNMVGELKEIRNQMAVYRGMDEAIKMYQDVKKELSQIKISESIVQKHADRVDTIFGEMGKSFGEFTRLSSVLKDFDQTTKQIGSDLDALKLKVQVSAQKKDVQDLTSRMNEFEKKVGSVMDLINAKFDDVERRITQKADKSLEKSAKLLNGFETLAKKVPDLDKYFNLIQEEAKKADENVKVEKIKQVGEEKNPLEEAKPQPQKKGLKISIPNPFKKKG